MSHSDGVFYRRVLQRPRRLADFWAGLILAGLVLAGPAEALADGECEAAIARAEQSWRLPEHLMQAMGLVEAGKQQGPRGLKVIWPWTLNVDGKAMLFPTREKAAAALRSHWQRGTRNIDVGCLQVNMRWNGRAFSDPEVYLDPILNAQWAGWRLSQLSREGKTLTDMVMSYHMPDSRKSERRRWYACLVQRELSILRGNGGERHPDCVA